MESTKISAKKASEVSIMIPVEDTEKNSSTQEKVEKTECQKILLKVRPQRAWGLVYANYHHCSDCLEVREMEKITPKVAAAIVVWILLAFFTFSIGFEFYLEPIVAHTVVGIFAVLGIIGICVAIYASL